MLEEWLAYPGCTRLHRPYRRRGGWRLILALEVFIPRILHDCTMSAERGYWALPLLRTSKECGAKTGSTGGFSSITIRCLTIRDG